MRTKFVALALATALLGCAAEPPSTPDATASAGLENGSFTAELNGFEIHYEVHGKGPVLMTVPNSWGLSLGGLRLLYRPLEEHVTMVYFDPRGMGGSAAIRDDADMGVAAVRDDFDALRRHLGLAKVHAIGWSNGAMNLVLLASEHPETLESAIFLHGAASFTEEDGQEMVAAYPDLIRDYGVVQELLASDELADEEKETRLRELYLDVWFPYMFADEEAGRAWLREAWTDVETSWRHAWYSEVEMPTFEARELLPEIPVRSLVISGAHDMLRPAKGEELAAGLPDARFVLFEDSGHFAPYEEPDRFVATVLEFLGLSARGTPMHPDA